MMTSPRPSRRLLGAAALAGALLLTPQMFADQGPLSPSDPWLLGAAGEHVNVLGDDPAMVNHPTPGYLGVGTQDIDARRAAQLKLKDTHGAEIIKLDHDAPACKAGIQLHDVILAMNNRAIAGEADFSQMLHNMPPGRAVTILISRNGQQQTFTVQLVDRASLEVGPRPVPPPDAVQEPSFPAVSGIPSDGFLSPGADRFYTGLELDMIGPQLAGYFGVSEGKGLLIKWVDDNSPAAYAGLRAGDVITKVDGKTVATVSQWLKTVRGNRGKQLLLTVIRDRRENTILMMAGRPKGRSQFESPLLRRDFAFRIPRENFVSA